MPLLRIMNNLLMKNRFLTIVVIHVFWCINAYAISVTISSGVDNADLKSRMENATACFLDEVNAAHASGRRLNFSALDLSQNMQRSIGKLWGNCPFVCTDDEIVESCIMTSTGYQIRNIPLWMKHIGDSDEKAEFDNAVICFDPKGRIVDFNFSIPSVLYAKVINEDRDIEDRHHRQVILDYVENLRASYIQKDISYMKQAYNKNSLIIIGKVIQERHGRMSFPKMKYKRQGKHRYFANLRRVFRNNKYLKVNFDEIEVMRHPVNDDFYGVTMHQSLASGTCHNGGYIFLLWDFRDESDPQIQLRTWQPDKIGKKTLPKDEIFTLSDFDI